MSDVTDDSFDEPTVLTDLTDTTSGAAAGASATGSATGSSAGSSPGHDEQPATEPTTAPTTAPASEPASVRAGDVFVGRYRLEQQLARRGSTLTWRAFDQKLSRSVLVHVLAPRDARTPAVLDAARKAAVATDSRFLRVLDAVDGDDTPALVVCEYAPGQSLEQLLQSGPLSAIESAWVVRELADAMGAMHDVGLFHQRLNPDTVIITATGNVKIVGFLIEAALHPDRLDEAPWAQREAADVTALGKLLYASLVAMWPTDADGDRTWGMPAAPTDARGWVMPRALNSGVSPALDAICDQVLSGTPRHNEMRLGSAKQVAAALGRVLGTADAAADLERRMRFPMTPVRPSTQAAVAAGQHAVEGARPGVTTRPPRPSSDATGENTARFDAIADAGVDHDADDRSSTASSGTDHSSRQGASTTRPLAAGRAVGQRRHRLAGVLVALVLVSLVVGLVGVLFSRNRTASSGSGGTGTSTSAASASASAASGTAWAIESIKDFDPAADGGNNEENPNEVALAHDGKTSTAWQTLTYRGSAKFGKLKPGVGLVLDLGTARQIGSVKLTLQGQPTGVQIMVPSSSTVSAAPMTSVKSWRTIASNASAGTSVTLTPTSSTTARFVLVYITSLPTIATDRYRAGIAEVQVLS